MLQNSFHGNALPTYAIIPARYASARFPAKIIADLGGKPLFWHAYHRTLCSGLFKNVYVAGDDTRIEEKAKELNIPYIMTKKDHPSGTDRVREAAQILQLPEKCIIANVQGDEPFVTKEMFQALLSPFKNATCQCASLGVLLDPIKDAERICSPHQVKIVCGQNGDALYFSRSPIPHDRDKISLASNAICAPYIGHIGLYAFTRDTLEQMANLKPSPLEMTEKLEQLRLLENNIRIQIKIIPPEAHSGYGVDTVEDLEKAKAYYERIIK